MKKAIKLHWASSKPNFGDCLSPLIVECVSGCKVVHAAPTDCDLVAIGSLLQRIRNHWWNRRIHIWGTGFIEEGKSTGSRHYIHAVRGPLSAARLESDVKVYGDPGLLAALLLDGKVIAKKFQISILAHYKDKDSAELTRLLELYPDAHLIDVFSDPIEVLSGIAASHLVLSSAMHGLIAADALGVPNVRLVLSGNLRGGDYKFIDYYRGINTVPLPVPDLGRARFEELVDGYSRPELDTVKQGLLASFPDI